MARSGAEKRPATTTDPLPPLPPSPSMWLHTSGTPDAPLYTAAGADMAAHDRQQMLSELDLFGPELWSNGASNDPSGSSGNKPQLGDPFTALSMGDWSSADSFASFLSGAHGSGGPDSSFLGDFDQWFGNELDPLLRGGVFGSADASPVSAVGNSGTVGLHSGIRPSTFCRRPLAQQQQHQPHQQHFHTANDPTPQPLHVTPPIAAGAAQVQPRVLVNGVFNDITPSPTGGQNVDTHSTHSPPNPQPAPRKRQRASPTAAGASLLTYPDPSTAVPVRSDPAPPRKRTKRAATKKRPEVANGSATHAGAVNGSNATPSLDRTQEGTDFDMERTIVDASSFSTHMLLPSSSRSGIDASQVEGAVATTLAGPQCAAAKPATNSRKSRAKKNGGEGRVDVDGSAGGHGKAVLDMQAPATGATSAPAAAQVPEPGRATTISTSSKPVNYHEQALRIMEMMGLAPTAVPAASSRARSVASAASSASSANRSSHVHQQQQSQPVLGMNLGQQNVTGGLADSGAALVPDVPRAGSNGNMASETGEILWTGAEDTVDLGMGQSEQV